jgi:hypothetical protein
MDVHPPHGPIHSVKEFMVHLLAITIGLLIALGLEASVEWLHHRHLAREARENILQEMRDNCQGVNRHLNAIPPEINHLQEILTTVNEAQSGRPHQSVADFNWTTVLLYDSSWNAAGSTGATTFMNYAEVKRYSKIYAAQKLYSSLMDRNLEARQQMYIFLARMASGDKLSDSEYEGGKRIILSAIIADKSLREIDNYLNGAYTELLSQGN